MPYTEGRAGKAAVLAVTVLAVTAALCWRGMHRRPAFPRTAAQHLSGPALDQALEAAAARVAASPDDLEAKVDLGVLDYHKGGEANVDAINELEAARDLGSNDPQIPYYLGVLYQTEGLPVFAMREFKRYLRTHPQHKEAELLLAKLFYQTGRYAEAAAAYDALARRFPKDPVVLENQGLSLLAARDTSRAREVFAALRDGGGEPGRRALYFLGNAYLQARAYKDALKAYAQAQPEGAEPPAGLAPGQVYSGLALASEGLGRTDLAVKAWQRVLERDPENLQGQAKLIELRTPHARPVVVSAKKRP